MLLGTYDVIVVGAGHAGCEAALAASRLGCRVLCLTTNLDAVGLMPCNPAMGGPGKAQLIREVDALGGQIGLNTDAVCLQMRTLNTGKGPAVWALRAQCDKREYQRCARRVLETQRGLDLKQGLVVDLVREGRRVCGVRTLMGEEYRAKAVVLTTGVYLAARVTVGDVSFPSGPSGQLPAVGLSAALQEMGLELGRFKTGTPPRVHRRSVDFERMTVQPGDERPEPFSYLTEKFAPPQVPCWLTWTNRRTHEIIRANLHRAPLFTGRIVGPGPRYCPSVEDKVVRFPDKQAHQVFLEPEGMDTEEMYVLGMSTSLPPDVQLEALRTIPGLEQVEMVRPGYAIEYDYLCPYQLDNSLAVRDWEGLYSAGQLNGTSGYEEAAAQGLIAGINAALWVKGEPAFVLQRSEAYIGVLIDDLVTKEHTEPYRMLTSRAEYRLLLRQDNADLRLTEKGRAVGLVDEKRYAKYRARRDMVLGARQQLETATIAPGEEVNRILESSGSAPLRETTSAWHLLRRSEVGYAVLRRLLPRLPELPPDVVLHIETEAKYEGYIRRQRAQVERFQRMEEKVIPRELDYDALSCLSREGRDRLRRVRPQTLGQAVRAGVSPADAWALLLHLEQRRRGGSAT